MGANGENFEMLESMIRDVKPSLGETPINLTDSMVENLGLDSLDILQLVRKVRRQYPGLDSQAWTASQPSHKFSVGSLVDAMGAAPASVN
ncbi:MAG: hypothetical protein JWQ27_3357 [Ferruginibacter sp.]|nr:hypothetical protein [Ferruginibacter sp.]